MTFGTKLEMDRREQEKKSNARRGKIQLLKFFNNNFLIQLFSINYGCFRNGFIVNTPYSMNCKDSFFFGPSNPTYLSKLKKKEKIERKKL